MVKESVLLVNGSVCELNGFRPGDDWEVFFDRLERYFEANLISEARRTAVLL